MTKLRFVVVVLGLAVLTGCASKGPFGVESSVNRLSSTGAGGEKLALASLENTQAAASEASDPCSGSRRMARIRCRW
jgi:hypothetical protein